MGVIKHGMNRTPEYKAWQQMKERCLNPRSQRYDRYGARGIKVCQRWRESFENFYADMGDRPSRSHSLDRKNNDGNYSCGGCEECRRNEWPDNCRWATRKEQNENKAVNVLLTFQGETLCVAEWSRRTGLHDKVIRFRMKSGWTTEEVLTLPVENRTWKKSPAGESARVPESHGGRTTRLPPSKQPPEPTPTLVHTEVWERHDPPRNRPPVIPATSKE